MRMNGKKLLAATMASCVLISSMPMCVAYADSVPVVTIGADLTEEQKETIFSFFGVSENSVQVIEINNSQERQYLEGLIPDEVIGTRTLSCSYILPTTSGGIVVRTANLTWVSDGMLANALLTAGIENCQVLATAPFQVSGTGALTGIFEAYETSSEGETLEEDKKNLATEELVVTGQLVDEVIAVEDSENPSGVKQITEAQLLSLLNDIKVEVLNGNLSEDKVKEIVDKHLKEYKINLTEDTYNRLISYLTNLSNADYAKAFKDKISGLSERITKGFDINLNVNIGIDFKTDKNSLEQFWVNVLNWLKFLFGDMAEDAKNSATSIFDSVNTSIISYDKSANGEEVSDEIDNSEPEDTQDDITNDVSENKPNIEGSELEDSESEEVNEDNSEEGL